MIIKELIELLQQFGDEDMEIESVEIPPDHEKGFKRGHAFRATSSDGKAIVAWEWSARQTSNDPEEADRRERMMKMVVESRVSACFGDGQNEDMAEYGSAHFGMPVWAMTNGELRDEFDYDPEEHENDEDEE